MNIVAIKFMSSGNETVGEMWRETKVFPPETPVIKIFEWASNNTNIKSYKGQLEITIAQE